jgi:nucleoid-associated protein YgaU
MKHLVRDLLALAAGCGAVVVLLGLALAIRPDPETVFSGSVSALPGVAGFAAAAAGLAIALWWILAMALAVVSVLLHKAGRAAAAAAAGAFAPAFMKRLAAAALGINLLTGAGAAQAADPLPSANPGQSVSLLQSPLNAAVHPQWGPTTDESGNTSSTASGSSDAENPASAHWQPSTGLPSTNVFIRPGRSDAAAQAVVVRAGDSLWSIAANQLGPQATDAEIAAHWPRWYERNRETIGSNPHLIIPGQVLEAPDLPLR